MSVHEQYAEDLALYALGGLLGNERALVEKHLETCADCRRELELLLGDMALLAFASTSSAPPRRSRQRLMDAIHSEPRRKEVSTRRPWWAPMPWFAAAV